MAKLPYPNPEQISDPATRAFLQILPPINLLRLEALAEGLVEPIARLSNGLWTKSTAPVRLRLVTSIRTAQLAGSPYEVAQLANVVRAFGIPDSFVEIAAAGTNSDQLSAEELLAAKLAEELSVSARASNDTLNALLEFLSPRDVCELVIAAGFYQMQSRVIETFEIELEDEQIVMPANMGQPLPAYSIK